MSTDAATTTEHLDTEDEHAFRLGARAHLAQSDLPPRVPNEPVYKWDDDAFVARDRSIQRALWDGGLAGITVPVIQPSDGESPRSDSQEE